MGPLRSLRLVMGFIPVVFFLTPFTSLLPTSPNLQQPAIEIVMILKGICTTIAFPSSTILLTNSASSLRTLGTLNGWATSVSALGRAAGPGLGGAFFTLGARQNCVGLPFWLFTVIAILSNIPLYYIVEGAGFGDDPEEDPAPAEQRNVVVERGAVVDPQSVVRSEADDEADAERSDSLPPLLSRTTSKVSASRSPSGRRSQSVESTRQMAIEAAIASSDDESESGDADSDATPDESGPKPTLRRKSSVPVGMGTGFRRLSSNLGQSMSGYGSNAFGGQ
jgi:hypothetical protein